MKKEKSNGYTLAALLAHPHGTPGFCSTLFLNYWSKFNVQYFLPFKQQTGHKQFHFINISFYLLSHIISTIYSHCSAYYEQCWVVLLLKQITLQPLKSILVRYSVTY